MIGMRSISPGNGYDLAGSRYAMLEVVSYKGRGLWECKCDCGAKADVHGYDLLSGHVRSCGCLRRNRLGDSVRKHGGTGTRLHDIWLGIRSRCLNSKNASYKNYGGRGITICDEWIDDFASFRDWSLKHGYRDDLTIDRIDNNGDYEPNNCRWATRQQQCANQRKNGKQKPVDEIDESGNVIRLFPSINQAATFYNMPRSANPHIAECCNGVKGRNTVYGRRFAWHKSENVDINGSEVAS